MGPFRVPPQPPPPPPPNSDPAIVYGSQPYHCGCLAEVDAHLADLAVRIRKAHALPRLVEAYRADLDALLDRRAFLEACDG